VNSINQVRPYSSMQKIVHTKTHVSRCKCSTQGFYSTVHPSSRASPPWLFTPLYAAQITPSPRTLLGTHDMSQRFPNSFAVNHLIGVGGRREFGKGPIVIRFFCVSLLRKNYVLVKFCLFFKGSFPLTLRLECGQG